MDGLGQRSYPTQSQFVKVAKNKTPKSFLLQKDLGDYCRKFSRLSEADWEVNACRLLLPRKQSVTDTPSFHNIKEKILACKREIKPFMSRLGHQFYPTQSVNVKGGVR